MRNSRSGIEIGRGGWIGGVALAVAVLASLDAAPLAGQDSSAAPTFSKDIAPLLQENCQICHRPGSIAPMSLLTYEEARPWARAIKLRTETRMMPPWHMDKTIGIQEFKNDISLSDEEIAMIGAWVDAGAPEGDPSDLPTPIEWPDYSSTWRLAEEFGAPDLVLTTEDYTVPANGLDQWFTSRVEVKGLEKERWIRAIEIRPSNPEASYVFHHGNSSLVQGDEESSLLGAAVGMYSDIFPEDSGKLIQPGSFLETEIHYFPVGEEVPKASMDIALYFWPEDQQPRFATRGSQTYHADATATNRPGSPIRKVSTVDAGGVRAVDIFIPPHGTQMVRGTWVVEQPTRLHAIRGHMHLRGKYQAMEAIYPDGRREVINKLNWVHNWHTNYIYADHVAPLFPKGTVLILTSWFDNTADNPYNPDPDQLVVFGRRSVDEMSHLWLGMTHFTEEEFAEVVAEREALLKQMETQVRQTR